MREVIEQVFRTPVREEYGAVENAVLATACEQGRLHVQVDFGLLEILLPTRSTHADDALDELKATVANEGRLANFSVSSLRDDAPWAHLKVLTADSSAAYIGSANVTGAGIGGHNLELGVLVRGQPVAVVDRILNMYRRR